MPRNDGQLFPQSFGANSPRQGQPQTDQPTVSPIDPGAIGAGAIWIANTGAPPYQTYVRNATNTGWETVGVITASSAAYDSWANQGGLASLKGLIGFTNMTWFASGGAAGVGPGGQNLLQSTDTGAGFGTIATINGLIPGSRVKCALAGHSFSGGGVWVRTLTAIGLGEMTNFETVNSRELPGGAGVYICVSGDNVVGADGQWNLQHSFQVGIGAMTIEVTTP